MKRKIFHCLVLSVEILKFLEITRKIFTIWFYQLKFLEILRNISYCLVLSIELLEPLVNKLMKPNHITTQYNNLSVNCSANCLIEVQENQFYQLTQIFRLICLILKDLLPKLLKPFCKIQTKGLCTRWLVIHQRLDWQGGVILKIFRGTWHRFWGIKSSLRRRHGYANWLNIGN